MNVSGARRRANLAIAGEPAESAAAQVVGRARILMLIAGLTTVLAIAAVVGVIGYRMFDAGRAVASEATVPLPQGARVLSTSASAGRLAVLIEVDGVNELLTFDIKTLRATGRLRFTRQP